MRRQILRLGVRTAQLGALPAVHAVQLAALHQHLLDALEAEVVPAGEQLRYGVRFVERQMAAAAQDQLLQLGGKRCEVHGRVFFLAAGPVTSSTSLGGRKWTRVTLVCFLPAVNSLRFFRSTSAVSFFSFRFLRNITGKSY